MQLEVFDMDKDGKSDLILSDDSGELAIYYGGSDTSGTLFTKKVLANDLGLRLSDKSIADGGAIRWNGISEIEAITQADYAREANLGAAAADSLTVADQARILNAKLYYQERTSRTINSPTEARATRIRGAIGDDPTNPGSPNTELGNLIESGINSTIQSGASGSVNTAALDQATIDEYKTYLRSEYAYGKNIIVSKTYRDIDGGTLKAGDRIEVKVSLSHSGANTLSDVVYLDSNPRQVFQPSENRTFTKVQGGTTSTGALSDITSGPYDLRFTGISIAPRDTVTLTYELKANQVRFGGFKVGLLETDDIYGDVSMSANAVCGEAETLWKSIEPYPRTYTKIRKEIPSLGDTKNALGGKFTDFNFNGQPDYIDLLS